MFSLCFRIDLGFIKQGNGSREEYNCLIVKGAMHVRQQLLFSSMLESELGTKWNYSPGWLEMKRTLLDIYTLLTISVGWGINKSILIGLPDKNVG